MFNDVGVVDKSPLCLQGSATRSSCYCRSSHITSTCGTLIRLGKGIERWTATFFLWCFPFSLPGREEGRFDFPRPWPVILLVRAASSPFRRRLIDWDLARKNSLRCTPVNLLPILILVADIYRNVRIFNRWPRSDGFNCCSPSK